MNGLGTFSMAQWSLTQLGAPAPMTPGRVEVMIDPARVTWDPCDQNPTAGGDGAAFLARMSQVDQATSDAELGPGQSDCKASIDLCSEPVGMSADGYRF
jgi:hypothetical protein